MTVCQRLGRNRLLNAWLPLVAWMGLIFLLSAQSRFPQTETFWVDALLGHGAHIFVFGVLAVLWVRALGNRPWAWPAALALTMLYALSDEFHQSFVPGRCMDPWDLLLDGIGAALGLGLWWWWKHRLKSRQGD